MIVLSDPNETELAKPLFLNYQKYKFPPEGFTFTS